MPTEGIYAAGAGMAAQQARLDGLANDIANVNTTGYKRERIAFRDLVDGAGAASADLGRSFGAGVLNQTGDPLSVAIVGPGFFQVGRADGTTALTRDGQFAVDANGAIVTQTGEQLQPPLTLPKGTDPASVSIAADGTVSAAGKTVGKLAIVDVPAPNGLLSLGNSLYAATAASGRPAATTSTVEQGFVEASNVDLAATMTDMIEAQRGYELASRAIKTQDELMDVANQLMR